MTRMIDNLYWWPNGAFIPPLIPIAEALAARSLDPRFIVDMERVIAAWRQIS